MASKSITIGDSLVSVTAQLGTDRDKAATVEYVETYYTDQELQAAYRQSWLARKIVDLPALDTFRKWRQWQGAEDQIEKLEAAEKDLKLQSQLLLAYRMARLYGTCYLYFSDGSATPTQPLDPSKVRKGGLQFITVLSHAQLVPFEMESDLLSPDFGKPKYYQLSGSSSAGSIMIHPSRVVVLYGQEDLSTLGVLAGTRASGDAKGRSVLNDLLNAVKNFDSTTANIASLTFEAKVDVISVKGLTDTIVGNPQEEAKLLSRYRLAASAKGNNGLLLLDGDYETYEQKAMSFGSLPEIMDRMGQNVSGGSDIPITRLFGKSPAGLNSTGESDLANYYDGIGTNQELVITPALEAFDEALIRHALGTRPPELHYKWASLWQMSDKERAELGKLDVDTINTLKGTGLVPEEVLSKAAVTLLTQDGVMPGLEVEMQAYVDENGEPDFGEDGDPNGGGDSDGGGGGAPAVNAMDRSEDRVRLGDKASYADQPRAPKGSANGGQWVSKGGGGGAASKAAASIATSKYSAEQVLSLTTKDPKSLSHYEKKVLAKYKKALSAEVASENAGKNTFEKAKAAGENVTGKPDSGKSPPSPATVPGKPDATVDAAKAKALASVATPAYPAEKIQGLMTKDPKDLSQYEKKKLLAYKKALQAEQGEAPAGKGVAKSKPSGVAVSAAGKIAEQHHAKQDSAAQPTKLSPSGQSQTMSLLANKHGMQKETVEKLASGEWKPDPKKPYQAEVAKIGAEINTGAISAASYAHVFGASPSGTAYDAISKAAGSPPPVTSGGGGSQAGLASTSGPLTTGEQSAVTAYSGSAYSGINANLRAGGSHTATTKALQSAISKSVAAEDLVLVRGLSSGALSGMGLSSLSDLKPGGIIQDKGFVSTTRKTSVAENFSQGGYGLKVIVPKGKPVLPMKHLSNYSGEDEFLLPSGSKFRVIGVTENRVVTVEVI